MIDLASENVITLTNATQYLPKRRKGQRPHPATMFRWAQKGVRGIVLETLRVGGTLCTSTEALQRFCERCTNPTASPGRTTRARQKAFDDAARELDSEGVLT